MDCVENNIHIFNELVSLPIVISDFDGNKGSDAATPESPVNRENSTSSIHTTSSDDSQPNWTTGFGYYVDDWFSRMTEGMKRKLREACVEVLRRTDDMNDQDIFSPFDEDARLLD